MRVKRALIFLALTAAVGLFLALGGFSDVVTNKYPNLKPLMQNGRFWANGWLPDVLPPSSTDILISNNLDSNHSEGEFHFPPPEYQLLVDRTLPYPSQDGLLSQEFKKEIDKRHAQGFVLRMFGDGGSVWIFFCKAEQGYCQYKKWPLPSP